jgi:hypothetical protein
VHRSCDAEKSFKISSDGGNTGSKKFNWGYSGVWLSLGLAGVRSQAVRFCVCLAWMWLQKQFYNFCTFIATCKYYVSIHFVTVEHKRVHSGQLRRPYCIRHSNNSIILYSSFFSVVTKIGISTYINLHVIFTYSTWAAWTSNNGVHLCLQCYVIGEEPTFQSRCTNQTATDSQNHYCGMQTPCKLMRTIPHSQ